MKRIVGRVGWLLIGSGIGLLIVGGGLAYPYIHSRLAGPTSMISPPTPSVRPTAVADAGDDPTETEPTQTATQPELGGYRNPPYVGLRKKLPTDAPEVSPQPSPVTPSAVPPTLTAEPPEPEEEDRGGRPPTRIVVPTIGVDAPVVRASQSETQVGGETWAIWDVPDEYAAGWHETSALPGEPGNTVLSGHNTNNGEVFRDLYTLRAGDEVVVYSEEISHTYYVSQTLIVPEAGQPLEVRLKNARYAMPTDDERLTLITCHPYGSLRNRLIVIARPSE